MFRSTFLSRKMICISFIFFAGSTYANDQATIDRLNGLLGDYTRMTSRGTVSGTSQGLVDAKAKQILTASGPLAGAYNSAMAIILGEKADARARASAIETLNRLGPILSAVSEKISSNSNYWDKLSAGLKRKEGKTARTTVKFLSTERFKKSWGVISANKTRGSTVLQRALLSAGITRLTFRGGGRGPGPGGVWPDDPALPAGGRVSD